jgi:CYTH domain-containing protein
MALQRNGKYSCIELERRFLVRGLPEEIARASHSWDILDRYLPGTRLRLRRMESSDGLQIQRKLTQKYAETGAAAIETTITNLYLTEDEYRTLEGLGGHEIRKRRYAFEHNGRRFSVDVFGGRLAGLILAEAEGDSTAALAALALPAFFAEEVTDDPFFTGGALATIEPDELRHRLGAPQ